MENYRGPLWISTVCLEICWVQHSVFALTTVRQLTAINYMHWILAYSHVDRLPLVPWSGYIFSLEGRDGWNQTDWCGHWYCFWFTFSQGPKCYTFLLWQGLVLISFFQMYSSVSPGLESHSFMQLHWVNCRTISAFTGSPVAWPVMHCLQNQVHGLPCKGELVEEETSLHNYTSACCYTVFQLNLGLWS